NRIAHGRFVRRSLRPDDRVANAGGGAASGAVRFDRGSLERVLPRSALAERHFMYFIDEVYVVSRLKIAGKVHIGKLRCLRCERRSDALGYPLTLAGGRGRWQLNDDETTHVVHDRCLRDFLIRCQIVSRSAARASMPSAFRAWPVDAGFRMGRERTAASVAPAGALI